MEIGCYQVFATQGASGPRSAHPHNARTRKDRRRQSPERRRCASNHGSAFDQSITFGPPLMAKTTSRRSPSAPQGAQERHLRRRPHQELVQQHDRLDSDQEAMSSPGVSGNVGFKDLASRRRTRPRWRLSSALAARWSTVCAASTCWCVVRLRTRDGDPLAFERWHRGHRDKDVTPIPHNGCRRRAAPGIGRETTMGDTQDLSAASAGVRRSSFS